LAVAVGFNTEQVSLDGLDRREKEWLAEQIIVWKLGR
jgi:hypothetical protein